MPIYEYYCANCEHCEEILQKVNECPPEACSACKKTGSLSKKVSQTSFQLKGGGWYSDLYASTKGKPDNKTDSKKASSTSENKAEAKSETKAADFSKTLAKSSEPKSQSKA